MNISNVIIIHGAYGYPEENWFGWLKRRLEAEGITCFVPTLPTPEGQCLQTWLKVFNDSVGHLVNEKTILIGHSLGAAFILRWLEKTKQKLKSVILVGAFIGMVGHEQFDNINQSFFQTAFAWELIRQCSQHFISYYGTEDRYVSRSQFDYIANHLRADKIIVENAGHFNTSSGYEQFPHLLIQIQKIAQIKKGVIK
jgi:predicted alpha/beta hydrolase family esterase